MKKVFSVLILAVFMLSVVGCSSNNKSTNNGTSTTDNTSETDTVYMAYLNEHYEDVTDSLEEIREMLIEDVNDFDYEAELKEERQELETTYKYLNEYKNVPEKRQAVHDEYIEALNMGIEAINLAEAGDTEKALTKVDEAITLNSNTIVKYGIPVDND